MEGLIEYDVKTHIISIGDRHWYFTLKDAFNKIDPYIVVWSFIRGQNNNEKTFQGFWKVKELKAKPNQNTVLQAAKQDPLI